MKESERLGYCIVEEDLEGKTHNIRLSKKDMNSTKSSLYSLYYTNLNWFVQRSHLIRERIGHQLFAKYSCHREYFILETILTRKDTPTNTLLDVIGEIEDIAVSRGYSSLYTNTSVPRGIMERRGSKYVHQSSNVFKEHTYVKNLDN